MKRKERQALVDALLACPSVSDPDRRKSLISDLSDDIKRNIERSNTDTFEVMNIVTACLNYGGGLQELIEIIEFYEGATSTPFQAVKQQVAILQSDTLPSANEGTSPQGHIPLQRSARVEHFTNRTDELSPQDDIRNLIRNHNRRLQKLKEQQALHGLDTPPKILLEIEDIEAELEQLQRELKEIENDTGTLEQRVEQQRQRIANGLAEIRQQTDKGIGSQPDQKHLSVIGRPPLGVVEHFKDRVREREKIGQLLAEPATRLVSVIGHGGMGKTALASKVLRDLEQHRWPHTDDDIPLDGIVYLSTRTAGISLEQLFLDCAKMLGGEVEKKLNTVWTNPKLNTEDKVSHLLESLKDGRYVVLLDNMEDLLDDKGQLVDEDLQLFFVHSLTAAHGARLLVTSRLALAFGREVMRFDRQVKLLDGLPIPDGVVLLRELDPNGDYGLQDAPEEQLTQAVELVYGVPRALEVMAGILANDPFASLAEVMEQFFEHEDVVQALVEENYRRLDDNARRVIEALAVFKRPVPPLAVDYLLEPFVPGLDVLDIIRRLTRTNIVSIDRATKTVTLHPIDQDYAYSRLPEEGRDDFAYTRQALEHRAADYYVQLRTLEETWKTIDDLAPQLAEFEHRVRAGDYDNACQTLNLIDFDYLYLWGYYTKLVKLRQDILKGLTDSGLRVTTLRSLGNAYRVLGPFKRAIKFYEEALDIIRKNNDYPEEQVILLGNLGRAYSALGKIEQASKYYEEALVIARETGNRREEGIQLGHLGLASHALGQVKQAIDYYKQALVIAREIGDRVGEGDYLGSLGLAYHSLGQFERAVEFYKESLAMAYEMGNRRGEGFNLAMLGSTHRDLGQFEQAIEFYKKALIVARETGHRRGEGVDLGHLGLAYGALGRFEQAIQCHEAALVITREIGDYREEGFQLGHLGLACKALGQINQAIRYYKKALVIARETGDMRNESIWLDNLGLIYQILGQFERAIKYHKDALVIARKIGNRLGESYCLMGLGKATLAIDELSQAHQHCQQAYDLDMPATKYYAALMLGIILQHQHAPTVQEIFADAVTQCQARLDKTASLYEARYALATALVGQVVTDPHWIKEGEQTGLLTPALTEYQRALEICAAPGVVQDAIRDLELIQAAGIEGLEPVFELLASALEK